MTPAGTYECPADVVVTAVAHDGYELDDPTWSMSIVLLLSFPCDDGQYT